MLTPARRPDAAHGLRTPFERRIDWLNRLLAGELTQEQLVYSKQLLTEKDLDISEELPEEVEKLLIDVLGATLFKTTIDVLRQVVHLPRLLTKFTETEKGASP